MDEREMAPDASFNGAPSNDVTTIHKTSVWNRNFLLLFQGQLVSYMGDVVYDIALGFWILAKTGSTALMGTLMAASLIPSLVIAPFAGVIVDRFDRRRIMLFTDIVRGLAVVGVGLAAVFGFISVWMVFAAGILIGLGGAFFGPATGSVIPDIVPKDHIIQANSIMGMAGTSVGIAGSSIGGFLYKAIGASLLFLFNGISFLFSAIMLLFMKIPKVERHDDSKMNMARDLREAGKFVIGFRGLRTLVLFACAINFFGAMGIMLFIPLFQKNPALGPAKYGIFMAVFAVGAFFGVLATSILKTPPKKRFIIFALSIFLFTVPLIPVPFLTSLPIMAALAALSGTFNAIGNTYIGSTLQQAVPGEMRGKVFSTLGMVSQGLTPLSYAIGGVVAEFVPIPLLIAFVFAMTFMMFLPVILYRPFQRFIEFDPETEKVEDIM